MNNALENGRYLWGQLQGLSTVECRYKALNAMEQSAQTANAALERVRTLHRPVIVFTHLCTPDCFHPFESMPRPKSRYIVCEHCWNTALAVSVFPRRHDAATWPCQTSYTLNPDLEAVRTQHLEALAESDHAAAMDLITTLSGPLDTLPSPERVTRS